MGVESFAFHLLAFLAVVSALFGVILARDVRAGALWLLVSLLSVAGIYVLQDAALVAVLSIGIHASVVAALLLFAYMLVDPGVDELGPPMPARSALKTVGAVLASAIGLLVVRSLGEGLPPPLASPPGFGGQRLLGLALFREHWLPIALAALVLLASMVGSLILTKRRID